jgi:hypothetical protein
VTRVRPPTRYDRLKGEKIRTKEVRERDKEGRMDPTLLRSSPSFLLYFILFLIGLFLITM